MKMHTVVRMLSVLVCALIVLGNAIPGVQAATWNDETEESSVYNDWYESDDASETVYAVTGVNVRTGPGVKYERIDTLKRGECIERIGFADNGWSKVIYNGQEAYICSDYLTNPTEENISTEDVYETVYTTTAVNVRTGPDVNYKRIDTLAYGKSIVRTGIVSNGWSRVLYNGQEAYMCSEYLTDSKPAAGPSGGKLGTAGRLTIPSVGVDVALYHCLSSSEYASIQQSIVDAVDSAAYIEQCHVDGVLIADHKHQGFNAIKNAVPNETYAYIDFGSYTQTYICTAIGNGKNLGSDLVDWDGVSLNHDYIRHGLAMYTCNENSANITISYWKPV